MNTERCNVDNDQGKRAGDGIWVPGRELMKDLGDDGYQYSGILESDNITMKEMKELVSREYIRKAKLMLEYKLNAGNVIKGINTRAVVVIRYTGGSS